MANSPTKELENLWKALGFCQTPQRFLVTEKFCDRSFRENISKEDYSHYFFLKTPVSRKLERILCSNVFLWAAVTLAIVGLLCYEAYVAPLCFTSLVLGLFKSDTSILLFLLHMQHTEKQCGMILNLILKFLQEIFLQITIPHEAALQM